MNNDLGSLLPEIEAVAKEKGLVLFHGLSRLDDEPALIEWDTDRRTDFREFLDVATACGVKLICIHDYQFTKAELDVAIDSLPDADLPPGERRAIENSLNNLRVYVGFTGGLELSFDYQDNVYCFHLRTPWRREFINILNALDDNFMDGDEGGEALGGSYFSRN
jgi:hypothetical protein